MVGCMAWGMECAEGNSMRFEDLGVGNGLLASGRVVLVYVCFRAEGDEVLNAAYVIRVPVGDECMRNGGGFGG